MVLQQQLVKNEDSIEATPIHRNEAADPRESTSSMGMQDYPIRAVSDGKPAEYRFGEGFYKMRV
jgi:hypothetical protein